MGNTIIKMDEYAFKKHMTDKAGGWDLVKYHQFKDFAVFEFNLDDEMLCVHDIFVAYADYYDYDLYHDNVNKMVIINKQLMQEK